MKHIVETEWIRYINDELSDTLKTEYENHLYSCDQCLDVYMQAMEKMEDEWPIMESGPELTESIMLSISQLPSLGDESTFTNTNENVKEEQVKQKPFLQTITAHYLIAAGFTILLMVSGAFQSFTKHVDSIQKTSIREQTSITDELINKTFNWMDSIEQRSEEGVKK